MKNRRWRLFVLLVMGLARLVIIPGAVGAQTSDRYVATNLPDTKLTRQNREIKFGDIDTPVSSSLTVRAPINLTHSTDPHTITEGNSVTCMITVTQVNRDNHFYRVFDLDALGVTGDLTVESIDVGIEAAVGNGGSQPVAIKLYTSTHNPPDLAQ